jgi:hypothetical protein
MNAKGERESDSENFGTRITEFGVVVGKIRRFEVLRAILWIFLGLGSSLELFFKNQGLSTKTMDRGLITQKSRGFYARFSNKPE